MRLTLIGLLATAMAGGSMAACNRATPAANAASAASAEPSAPAANAPSADADASRVQEMTIPAGTQLPIVLDSTVGSDISRVEEPVTAHLSRPLVIRGETVLLAGSRVSGVVTDAQQSGRVKGLAHIAVRFESLTPAGDRERYPIRTSAVGRTAAATKKKDALEIGAPAAGGALIGGLLGGKKGALIGTAVGGGAGTAVVLSTRGKEVHLNRGAVLTLRLAEPVTVRVRS